MSDLSDDELIERFEALLWKVGDKIGQRHNDGGFEAELRPLRWTTLVGCCGGLLEIRLGLGMRFHASVDCYDDYGVVFKKHTINGKIMKDEEPVYSLAMMREYLPLLEQQIPLECLAEILDD